MAKLKRLYDELLYDPKYNSVAIAIKSYFFAGISGNKTPLTIERVNRWLKEENYQEAA